MSADARHDRLVPKTRKAHRCTWCYQEIPARTQMVRVAGVTAGEGWWSGKFHPECWRAEHHYWKREGDADSWPEDRSARGRTDDDFQLPPEFTDRPLIEEEVKNPWDYRDQWAALPAPCSTPAHAT